MSNSWTATSSSSSAGMVVVACTAVDLRQRFGLVDHAAGHRQQESEARRPINVRRNISSTFSPASHGRLHAPTHHFVFFLYSMYSFQSFSLVIWIAFRFSRLAQAAGHDVIVAAVRNFSRARAGPGLRTCRTNCRSCCPCRNADRRGDAACRTCPSRRRSDLRCRPCRPRPDRLLLLRLGRRGRIEEPELSTGTVPTLAAFRASRSRAFFSCSLANPTIEGAERIVETLVDRRAAVLPSSVPDRRRCCLGLRRYRSGSPTMLSAATRQSSPPRGAEAGAGVAAGAGAVGAGDEPELLSGALELGPVPLPAAFGPSSPPPPAQHQGPQPSTRRESSEQRDVWAIEFMIVVDARFLPSPQGVRKRRMRVCLRELNSQDSRAEMASPQ